MTSECCLSSCLHVLKKKSRRNCPSSHSGRPARVQHETASLWNTQSFMVFVLSTKDLVTLSRHDIRTRAMAVLSVRKTTRARAPQCFGHLAREGSALRGATPRCRGAACYSCAVQNCELPASPLGRSLPASAVAERCSRNRRLFTNDSWFYVYIARRNPKKSLKFLRYSPLHFMRENVCFGGFIN